MIDARTTRRRILEELATDGYFESVREGFSRIITDHNVPAARNLMRLSDWLVYAFHGRLVSKLMSDKEARIVDWGGLYGHVTQILRGLGYRNTTNYLLFVEKDYSLFEQAFDIPTIYGRSNDKLDLDSNSVDALISSGVLEHTMDDAAKVAESTMVREISRVLRPGGYFFLWKFPTKLGTSELLAILLRRHFHRYRYWKSDVVKLLGAADLEVVYLDKMGFLPGEVLALLNRFVDPVTLMKIDDCLAHLPLLSIFARDFTVIARKH